MISDADRVVLEIAGRVAAMAGELVVAGGFPPFGAVFAGGALSALTSFQVDTRDAREMRGAFDQAEQRAGEGEWYVFGYDATVRGQDALVFFIGGHGGAHVAKFALTYSVDDGAVTLALPARFERYVDRAHV